MTSTWRQGQVFFPFLNVFNAVSVFPSSLIEPAQRQGKKKTLELTFYVNFRLYINLWVQLPEEQRRVRL